MNFIKPINGDWRITSPFGVRLHPILKEYRKHDGIDIVLEEGVTKGAQLFAVASGRVIKAENTWGAYGNVIIIQHDYGIQTFYAHLDRIFVHAGDEVIIGQHTGNIGNTGTYTTGPHLHFGVYINDNSVDPELFY